MAITSFKDETVPVQCSTCGTPSNVVLSRRSSDSICPQCGGFLWVDAIAEITSRNQFVPDIRLPVINGLDRGFVLQQLVNAIATRLGWSSQRRAEFYAAIENREQLGSTGIGNGFAIPHASKDWIEAPCSVIAFVPNGIDFESLDGKPVFTVVMVASPKGDQEGRLRTMERISRSLRTMCPSSA